MIPTPNPYQREGSVDGWGKYGLRSSLLAFKTKWRKKGQNKSAQGNALGIVRNQHSPRMGKRIIISPTPLSFSNGGLSFFCPLRGRIPAASNSPGVARGWHINAPSGALTFPKYISNTHPFIYDRRTKGHDTPSLREGRGGLPSSLREWSRDGHLQSCGYRVALHGLPRKKQNKLFWFAIRA